MAEVRTTTLYQLVGDNVRRIREDMGESHDGMAHWVQDYGLRWTRKVVAAVEAGQREIGLVELLLLSVAYDKDLAWWLTTDGGQVQRDIVVELNESVRVPIEILHAALAGAPYYTWRDFRSWDVPSSRRFSESASFEEWMFNRDRPRSEVLAGDPIIQGAMGVAEQKAARQLGIDAVELSELAHGCWGRGLTEERDARVEDELPKDAPRRTKQAVRGHVTRELMAELEEHRQTEVAKEIKPKGRDR